MTNVVISQSMLFPWVGMLEQMLLADVFIHYDDVQFSKGSFTNRVQLNTESGSLWMTVPLMDHKFGQAINEVRVQPSEKWISKHLASLELSFSGAPYRQKQSIWQAPFILKNMKILVRYLANQCSVWQIIMA